MAVADREPELVEAEVLVLTAVAEALVVFAFAVKTTTWVAVTRRGWNELKEDGDDRPHGRCTCHRGGTSQGEDEDGVGALAADQDIEEPVGLEPRTSIALGSAGVSPLGSSSDATLRPLP